MRRNFARVLVLAVIAPFSLAVVPPPPVLADGPEASEPEQSFTPAQAADYQRRLTLANAAVTARVGALAPEPICVLSPCEPTSKTLDMRARQQVYGWYCGPASGQVLINWSRGYFYSSTDGRSTTTNWKPQSTLASWMSTTQADGTSGPHFTSALNRTDAIHKPYPDWLYVREVTGAGPSYLQTKVIMDVAGASMGLGMGVAPHEADQDVYHLASWPSEHDGVRHWIALRGYTGRVSDVTQRIYYNDSSAGLGGGTGSYSDLTEVVYQVNQLNQGYVVW